jgi:Zn-dependent peptidase ImmA (M78 family)
MSKQYRRSLLTFYLAEPPKKGDRGEDFRTLPPDRSVAADALLDALIRDLKARQSLVRATLEDEEEPRPLAFIGSARMADGVPAALTAIQRILKVDLATFRACKSPETAFTYLRERAEDIGIFVLLVGNLGSHHSAIPVEAFRGFAIADPIAPFVVINDQDARTAWCFTLVHEITHLWLGTTGISGSHAENTIERFCNDVAGELLLPKAELKSLKIGNVSDIDAVIAMIAAFAEERNLSRPMVAYKLYRAGTVTLDAWRALDGKLREIWLREKAHHKERERKSDSGPSYYIVRRHRLGRALLEFASRNVSAGTLSPVKAAKILGVKPRSVYPLLLDIQRPVAGWNKDG